MQSCIMLRLSIFLLIQGLVPTSTLFPYTTLFRSEFVERAARPRHQKRSTVLGIAGFVGGADRRPVETGYADRKSTRLNSSHLGISYAVFCLKKKKKPILSPLTSLMIYSKSLSIES